MRAPSPVPATHVPVWPPRQLLPRFARRSWRLSEVRYQCTCTGNVVWPPRSTCAARATAHFACRTDQCRTMPLQAATARPSNLTNAIRSSWADLALLFPRLSWHHLFEISGKHVANLSKHINNTSQKTSKLCDMGPEASDVDQHWYTRRGGPRHAPEFGVCRKSMPPRYCKFVRTHEHSWSKSEPL